MSRIQKRRYYRKVKKCILGALTLALVLGFAISNSSLARAEDCREAAQDGSSAHCKYYKSIILESGDTLWSIALEYKDSNYDSIQEYIDELMKINGLTSDRIHSGRFLTVPYYR